MKLMKAWALVEFFKQEYDKVSKDHALPILRGWLGQIREEREGGFQISQREKKRERRREEEETRKFKLFQGA